MSTLSVSTTTDYRLTDLTGTDSITFTNVIAESFARATFSASQFASDVADPDFEIAFAVLITGTTNNNEILIDLSGLTTSFSAAGFVFSGWNALEGDRLVIDGSRNDETITDSSHADAIDGNQGEDVISSRGGGDTLHGGADSDRIAITGASARDDANLIYGDGARDTLTMTFDTTGDATYSFDGGSGRDTFVLHDRTTTAATIDISDGGGGRYINGNVSLASIERLNLALGSAADTVTGGAENDIAAGRGGADVLSGGAGDDRLTGGLGGDTLTGGADADTFIYNMVLDSRTRLLADHITDFTHGEDLISLAAIDAISGGSDDSFTFIGNAGFSHVAGELRAVAGLTDTVISADLNGDTRPDLVIVLDTVVTLTDLDFLR